MVYFLAVKDKYWLQFIWEDPVRSETEKYEKTKQFNL
jgi:hypothetical protein